MSTRHNTTTNLPCEPEALCIIIDALTIESARLHRLEQLARRDGSLDLARKYAARVAIAELLINRATKALLFPPRPTPTPERQTL